MRRRILSVMCILMLVIGMTGIPCSVNALGKTIVICPSTIELGQDFYYFVKPVDGEYYVYSYIRNVETNEIEFWSSGLTSSSSCTIEGYNFKKAGKKKIIAYGESPSGERTEPFIAYFYVTGEREKCPNPQTDFSSYLVNDQVNITMNTSGSSMIRYDFINTTSGTYYQGSWMGGVPVAGTTTSFSFVPEDAGLYEIDVALKKDGKWTDINSNTKILVWNGVATPTDLDALNHRDQYYYMETPDFVLEDETVTDTLDNTHTLVEDKEKAATCTETGLTKGWHCADCGEILVAQEVIPAKGHQMDDGVVIREATTSEPGIKKYTCTVCGYTEEKEIPKLISLGLSGWTYNDGGWLYGDPDGNALLGPHSIDGIMYCFNEKGKMITGWEKVDGKWYYADSSGELYHSGWYRIDNVWYYFRPDGAMATGWVNDRGTYYYMKTDGTMATGWIEDHGDWYYMSPKTGALYTGWRQEGNAWYLLKPNGAMATGWYNDGGTWYYFKGSGVMATNEWIEDEDLWFWLDKNGAMAIGWQEINGKWEQFSDSGVWLQSWDGN